VGDPDKRARFDRGEIDASGAEKPRQRFYRDFANQDGGNPYVSGEADFAESDDILSELLRRSGRADVRMRGQDSMYRLPLEFLDAINGAKRQVTLPDGSALEVTIPAGSIDGQILRLKGKGQAGIAGGPPGDALVEIEVRPHRIFRRQGDDIHVALPLTLREAVLGGKVVVPTPTGPVSMTVPKWSSTGTILRLKGKGAIGRNGNRGDEYVTLQLMLPEKPDPELERLIAEWRPTHAENPRRGMETTS
jgi:DnaJ-class molecular chaperone